MYFYPKAATPGCTTEACDFRDNLASLQGRGYEVLGISPDAPEALAGFTGRPRPDVPAALRPGPRRGPGVRRLGREAGQRRDHRRRPALHRGGGAGRHVPSSRSTRWTPRATSRRCGKNSASDPQRPLTRGAQKPNARSLVAPAEWMRHQLGLPNPGLGTLSDGASGLHTGRMAPAQQRHSWARERGWNTSPSLKQDPCDVSPVPSFPPPPWRLPWP